MAKWQMPLMVESWKVGVDLTGICLETGWWSVGSVSVGRIILERLEEP